MRATTNRTLIECLRVLLRRVPPLGGSAESLDKNLWAKNTWCSNNLTEIIKDMDKHRKLWSINSLCSELQRNFRTISKALINVPADGTLNGRPGWHMSTAISAMRKYEGDSNRFDGRSPVGEDTFDAIEEASINVDQMFKRMRAEPDVEKRRKILEEDGHCVGRLHQAIEADFAARGKDHRALFGPWAREQFVAIMAETLSLCEWRLELEDGTIYSPPELISDEQAHVPN